MSHKDFRRTVAISLLMSDVEARPRCSRTADLPVDVRYDSVGHLGRLVPRVVAESAKRTPGAAARNVAFGFTSATAERHAALFTMPVRNCSLRKSSIL